MNCLVVNVLSQRPANVHALINKRTILLSFALSYWTTFPHLKWYQDDIENIVNKLPELYAPQL